LAKAAHTTVEFCVASMWQECSMHNLLPLHSVAQLLLSSDYRERQREREKIHTHIDTQITHNYHAQDTKTDQTGIEVGSSCLRACGVLSSSMRDRCL
jgi:hypothetical protein